MPTPSDFTNVQFGKDQTAERSQGNLGVSGDYGQISNAPATADVPLNSYPNLRGYGYDSGNSQFSQDKENDPIRLMESTRVEVNAHADLNASYGLLQPVATLGSHPFLRDSLTTPDELAPGNAEPQAGLKIPKRG